MGQPAGSACVWVVAALLLLLAGGGCLVLYVTLPPVEVPSWLLAAGLALATCAYRCCGSCSPAAAAAAPGRVERQPSARSPAAVAPLPSASNLKSALSKKHTTHGRRSPSPHGGVRRVRFGDSTVLGEEAEEEVAAAAEETGDAAASVHSHES